MPNCPHCSSIYCKGNCLEIRKQVDELFGPELARYKAKEKKRDNGEDLLQISFVNWMPKALPHVKVWHVRNEKSVNAIQGKQMKDKGVVAGVHDMHLMWPTRNFATIELKSPNLPSGQSKYSEKQSAFAESMNRCGFLHACCQNGKQIADALVSFGLLPNPRFPFPASLSSSAKQMRQMSVAHEMNRCD